MSLSLGEFEIVEEWNVRGHIQVQVYPTREQGGLCKNPSNSHVSLKSGITTTTNTPITAATARRLYGPERELSFQTALSEVSHIGRDAHILFPLFIPPFFCATTHPVCPFYRRVINLDPSIVNRRSLLQVVLWAVCRSIDEKVVTLNFFFFPPSTSLTPPPPLARNQVFVPVGSHCQEISLTHKIRP